MSEDDEIPNSYEDPIASRTQAYAELLANVINIQEGPILMEAMAMLAAVRETVRTGPKGELRKIK